MKRILITGASGFIGSFLVEEAIKDGYDVYAGVRKTSNLQYLSGLKVSKFEVDLSSKQEVIKMLLEYEKFDYIIHNAGLTKTCNKKMFDIANLKNTQNFIEALQETNRIPNKFIYISSLAAFGPSKHGTKPMKLTDKPIPVSQYGNSKLKTEVYIKSIHDFPYLIFMPTGVYGPREKDYLVMYKSIKSGIETYIGSKKQYLSFVYVKDLSELLLKSLKSDITRESYFVSDLNNYTAVEFNDIVKKELNKKTITLVFPKLIVKFIALMSEKISCALMKKVPTLNIEKFKDISESNWLCDSSKLVSDFSFNPKYNLQRGVKEAINWYKKNKLL